MDWQQIVSLSVVAVAAVLLVRNTMVKRKRAAQHPCEDNCGCSPSAKESPAIHSGSTFHQSKNETKMD